MSSVDLGAAQLAHRFYDDPTFIAVVLREYWFEFQDQMSVTKYDRWTHISCPEFKLGTRLYWQLHKIFGAIDAAAAKSTLIREGFEQYRPRFKEFLARIELSQRSSVERIPEDIDDLIGLLEFALTESERLEEESTQTRSTPSTYGTPHPEHPKKGGEPPETPYERSIRLGKQLYETGRLAVTATPPNSIALEKRKLENEVAIESENTEDSPTVDPAKDDGTFSTSSQQVDETDGTAGISNVVDEVCSGDRDTGILLAMRPSELCRAIGCSDSTLLRKAKSLEIPTASRGDREFKYEPKNVLALLECFSDSSQETHRENAKKFLKDHVTEIDI